MKVMLLEQFKLKYEYFISIIILVSTLTAFAIIPSVPATVPSYLFIIILLGLFLCFPLKSYNYQKTLSEFLLFVALFILLIALGQLSNWLFPVVIPRTIVLIDSTDYFTLLFRSSLFTQSAYLICDVFLYLIIKNYSSEKLLKPLLWAFRLLIIYGIYEFIYYSIFRSSGDFISNRIYSNQEDGVIGGSFQLQNLGATSLLRIKGFTGEPSMFSFVTLPYYALLVGLKKRWESVVCLICLILTFSTTAYIGLLVYVFYLMFFSSNRKLKYTLIGIVLALIVLFLILLATNELFQELINAVFIDKLSGNTVSGDERSSFFLATFSFWKNSDILHMLFGYGFGYARSTDFFSTLLFNVGLIGFLSFTVFIFSHFFISIQNKSIKENYRAALVITYFVMMTSVPEYAYCSLWVVLASGYILKNYNFNNSNTNVIYQL